MKAVGNRVARVLAVLYGVAIAAVSLYPLEFRLYPKAPDLFWIPLTNQRVVVDAILNLFLYAPFGALGALSLRRRWQGLLAAIVVGTGLSWTIESLQLWSPSRYGNLTDLVFNALGTGLGAITASIATRMKRLG